MILDQTHKAQLTSLRSFSVNSMNQLHVNERISACDQKHRQYSLENIALQYQFFRTEEVSEDESEKGLRKFGKFWIITMKTCQLKSTNVIATKHGVYI